MTTDNLRFKREILGVATLLTLGSIYVLYPFLDAIILAAATAYILRYVHGALNQKVNNDLLSSTIVISSVIGLISLGLFFFVNNFHGILSALEVFIGDLSRNINGIIEFLNLPEQFRNYVAGFLNSLLLDVESYLRATLAAIPRVVIDLGIYLVTLIFLYKDGDKIKKKIYNLIDDLPENEGKIIKSLIRSIDSIFRGVFMTQILVAAVLGLIAALGFYAISNLTSPIPLIPLWSVLIGIAALLPLVAGFMFYGPLGAFYFLAGQPVKGGLILTFGIVVINILPEIFLRPYIGARQMNEHPLIIFIGFLAGPLTLGIKGIILGPLLLILTKEFILNYTDLVSSASE